MEWPSRIQNLLKMDKLNLALNAFFENNNWILIAIFSVMLVLEVLHNLMHFNKEIDKLLELIYWVMLLFLTTIGTWVGFAICALFFTKVIAWYATRSKKEAQGLRKLNAIMSILVLLIGIVDAYYVFYIWWV